MPVEPLEVQLLGDFQIRRGPRVIPADAWKLRKAAGIVKLLALEPGHRLHREQLLDTLWPELDPEAAANNFRYALHTARQALDPERSNTGSILFRDGSHLVIAAPDDVWVDVEAFEKAVEAAWRGNDPSAHRAAIQLYAGDLLPDDRYEEWLELPRPPFLACLNYVVLGELAGYRGDLQTARAYYETTVELAKRLDSMLGLGWAFQGLGSIALARGDYEQAIAHYQESLRLCRIAGSATGTSLTAKLLGDTLLQSGRFAEARLQLEETLALDRQMGHMRDVSQCLTLLGTVARYEDRHADAAVLLEEGLTIAQTVGHVQVIGEATAGLANFMLQQKATQDAARLFQESLRAALRFGDVIGIARAIDGLAAVSDDEGDAEGAIQRFAAAAAYRESVDISLAGIQKVRVDARLDRLRGFLPADTFETAWTAGLWLTPSDVVQTPTTM